MFALINWSWIEKIQCLWKLKKFAAISCSFSLILCKCWTKPHDKTQLKAAFLKNCIFKKLRISAQHKHWPSQNETSLHFSQINRNRTERDPELSRRHGGEITREDGFCQHHHGILADSHREWKVSPSAVFFSSSLSIRACSSRLSWPCSSCRERFSWTEVWRSPSSRSRSSASSPSFSERECFMYAVMSLSTHWEIRMLFCFWSSPHFIWNLTKQIKTH